MATKKDAEAGWEIFKEGDYALSLDEINSRLTGLDCSPVSSRMYQHYRKLQRYGYEQYVPINQLDVKTLHDPVWDKATRSRYLTRRLFEPVTLRLLVDSAVREFRGQAVALSESEVVIRLQGPEAVTFFEGIPQTDALAEVEFEDEIIALGQISRVVIDSDNRLVTIRLSFSNLVPADRIIGRTLDWMAYIDVYLDVPAEDLTLAQTVQVLYWLLQGLEATRMVCQDLLDQLDPEEPLELSPPRLARLEIESLDAIMEGPWPYFAGFLLMWRTYARTSKVWWERNKAKEEALKLRWENQQKGIERGFEPKMVVTALVDLLKRAMDRSGKQPALDQPQDTERAETLLEKQAFPAVRQLEEVTEGRLELDAPDEELPDVDPIQPAPAVRVVRRRPAAGQGEAKGELPAGDSSP